MNIFVSNFGFSVRDEDLKEYFSEYGEVTSAKVIMDRETNRSKGFGFVEMTDDAAANKAITELNGAMIDGRPIRVSEARPREERPSGGGGYGGGRGGSGGGGSRGGGGGYNKKSW